MIMVHGKMEKLTHFNYQVERIRIIIRIVISVIFVIYYFVCIYYNSGLLSFLWLWPLGAGYLLADAFMIRIHIKSKFVKIIYNIYCVLRLIFISIVCILIFNILANQNGNRNVSCDYIIVLGARVIGDEPSDALANRIETAYSYYQNNNNVIIIASGGRGIGENISEGKCIFNELVKNGVPKEKILIENESTTTYENIKFSITKINRNYLGEKIGIVTNDYHIFRAISMCKYKFGIDAYGIPIQSSNVLMPHYILREVTTFCLDTIMGHIFH